MIKLVFDRVETFFDRIKLGYKWRFDRWKDLQVQLYRGYGTPECLYVKGRVLDDRGVVVNPNPTSAWRNILDTLRRIETDDIPGATVRIRLRDQVEELTTDEDGYFDVTLHPEPPLSGNDVWHDLSVELLEPRYRDGRPVQVTGQVLVPPPDAEFGVISDVDDTVVRTGARDRFKMFRTILLNSVHTRVPFEGVADFYRALRVGPDGKGHNPVFYVSSSPWNLYGIFDAFFKVHDLPAGPLFLKDFGFEKDKFFKSGHAEHKLECIRLLMSTYPELPFVLIGDSGQHDPEIYRQAAIEYPGRISAIFIRDVTSPKRDREVHEIADTVTRSGTPMILVQDSAEATTHALRLGLIRVTVPAGV